MFIFFLAERRRKQKGSTSPLQDEPEEEELDEETQALDAVAMERIKQILTEYQEEMNNFELKKEGKCEVHMIYSTIATVKSFLLI